MAISLSLSHFDKIINQSLNVSVFNSVTSKGVLHKYGAVYLLIRYFNQYFGVFIPLKKLFSSFTKPYSIACPFDIRFSSLWNITYPASLNAMKNCLARSSSSRK